MSVEQAKAFIERMKTDEAFREKVLAIEDLDNRLAAIREAGYFFAIDDLNNIEDTADFDVNGGKCWAFYENECFSVGESCWLVTERYCSRVG